MRRLAEQALAPDLSNERVADVLRQAYAPSFFVMAFHGYDKAGHQFYRYAHPEAFGNVPPDEARRYGHVLSGYTALVGRWVLGLEKTLQPGDVLVVLSGHGLAPTPLWRRLLGVLTGTEVGAASHADAPAGVFVAVGGPVRAGAELRGASVLDVAPTLLYLMGLPVARDMEGRVLERADRRRLRQRQPRDVHSELREPRGRSGRSRAAGRRPAAAARRAAVAGQALFEPGRSGACGPASARGSIAPPWPASS